MPGIKQNGQNQKLVTKGSKIPLKGQVYTGCSLFTQKFSLFPHTYFILGDNFELLPGPPILAW